MIARSATQLTLLLVLVSAVFGQQRSVIFQEDFEGDYTDWQSTGAGTVSNVSGLAYDGSSSVVSLNLRARFYRIISTEDYRSIQVTVSISAENMYAAYADRCSVEYSTSKGAVYNKLIRLLPGFDTAIPFEETFDMSEEADNNPNFAIRFRASTLLEATQCLALGVQVTGVMDTSQGSSQDLALSTTYDPLDGSGNVSRSVLTFDQLFGTASIDGPIDVSAFDIPEEAAEPTNFFQAPLESIDHETAGEYAVIRDDSGYASSEERFQLPKIFFSYISHGSHFIPELRTFQIDGHPFWEFVPQPGRVWDEVDDMGFSRVSIPFAITQRNQNCVHNGLMTFLFKNGDDGESIANITKAYYQISAETCLYFKFNLWGSLTVDAQTTLNPNADTIRQDYENEVASRLPSADISALEDIFPELNTSEIAYIDFTNEHISAFGVWYDGIFYRGGFDTRHGTYPFPDVMAFPSFSTAKSFFVSLGAMAFHYKYPDEDIYNRTIAELIETCNSDLWSDVSLEDALDMSTGNYDSDGYEVDEGSDAMLYQFFLLETQRERLNFACRHYERKSEPGTVWVYQSPVNYLVATALRNAIAEVEPETGTLLQFAFNEYFSGLNISSLMYATKSTYDDVHQEMGTYGFLLTLDDYAKFAKFVNEDEGMIDGVRILDYERLKVALQRDDSDRGNDLVQYPGKYKLTFWATDIYSESYTDNDGSTCTTTLEPYMSGFGGIGVYALKSKLNYIFVNDNNEHDPTSTLLMLAQNAVEPCAAPYSP